VLFPFCPIQPSEGHLVFSEFEKRGSSVCLQDKNRRQNQGCSRARLAEPDEVKCLSGPTFVLILEIAHFKKLHYRAELWRLRSSGLRTVLL
jgi:hypothetical protein